MICRNFTDRVDEWIDGVLPAQEADELRAHAESCSACREDAARAERFRTLLAGPGRAAILTAADRAMAERVRTTAAPVAVARPASRPPLLRRLALPLAAAALVLVSVTATAWLVGGEPTVARGDVALARGERRVISEGRTVVADDDVLLEVLSDERVRLDAGLAQFQVEHGRPFVVETHLGDAEVRGTLFHVARGADGSVSIGVVKGCVVFMPRRGSQARTMRAGSWLEVAPNGTQTHASTADVAEIEGRLRKQQAEIAQLRADRQQQDGDLNGLREELAEARELLGPRPDPWSDIGVALRKLLQASSAFDANPAFFEAQNVLLLNASTLGRVTGSQDARTWPWHPQVLSRGAHGFVGALAPNAGEEQHRRAVEAIRAACENAAERTWGDPYPAQIASARLALIADVTTAVRDTLGPSAAAEIARARPSKGVWMMFRRLQGTPDEARFTLVGVAKMWNLDDTQKIRATPLVERWVAATVDAQRAVEQELGEDVLKDVLPAPRGTKTAEAPRPTAPLDDAQAVDVALRRIEARKRLLAPWIDFERAVWELLTPEQQALRGRAPGNADAWE